MFTRLMACSVCLVASFALLLAHPTASAQEARGNCKINRTNGPPLEGEVTEYADRYELKQAGPGGKGTITITIRKTEVTRIEPLSADAANGAPTAGSPGRRPPITEAMVAEILGSDNIDAASLDIEDKVQLDVTAPLESDKESEAEMLRIAGKSARLLYTDHFTFTYTTDIKLAKDMAANLERVYRWAVFLNNKNGVKSIRPKHKLEIYFFGTFEEYDAYQTTNGFRMMGAIGFYNPPNNRSAFFDMMTWPPTVADLEAAKASNDPQERRKLQNKIKRRMANYNAEVVQHEAGHHIHFNLGVFPRNTAELPTWAVEGLATMFEVVEGEAGASYGAINHNRLSQFRRIYGENGERIPDMRIVILNNGWWNGFPSYSMGWALNHYLSRCAKHAEAYKKWMQLLAARDDGERIELTELQRQFEQLFGDIDDTWRQEFIDYMKTIQLKQSEVNWEP